MMGSLLPCRAMSAWSIPGGSMMNRYLVAAGLGAVALATIAGTTLAYSPAVNAPLPAEVAASEVVPEVWPMPVEDFLAGNFLERADVVLTRRDWNFSSWLIRWATDSPFTHAAMVFT